MSFSQFQANLEDETAPLAIQFEPERAVLMLAFGGLSNRLGFPMFEFNKLTRALDNINKIYLRDSAQCWYHNGLPGVGGKIDEIAGFLRVYTTHPATKKVVILGNSGGGYAALLFGHLLQADEVHAFSPKTFLHPIQRLLTGDWLSLKKILFLWFSRSAQREYYDLAKILPGGKTSYHLYFASQHKTDRFHAERLQGMPGVQLHPYSHQNHNLVKKLRKNGDLVKIIENALRLD